MLTEEQIIDTLKPIHDPHLDKSLVELDAVKEVKIKDNLVSIKLAIAEPGTAEQMQLQQEVVNAVKTAGAESVGLRFEKLADDVIAEHRGVSEEEEETGTSLLERGDRTTFIAVTSGKGGVGKSTVSVNLATSLARKGKKVGIIDADIYGFSVPDMMGIEERPKVVGQRIYPVTRFDVQVISMGFFVEDNSPIIWRGPMLGKMLNNFFNEVEWDDLDYLILDLPPGTGDVALDVHSMLPGSKELIVTTPHATAAFVAARAGAMAMKTEHEILGIVENMAYFESKLTGEKEYVFGTGGGDKLSEELQADVLARIPLGQPVMDDEVFAPSVYDEEHPIGKIYMDLADSIIKKIEDE
ncbi:P-loop NTPase [Salisediminibacterium halotolerans]|uniref:P-loop NTPase n=1 Tax=Salisediminibacterium halotolerans TaxID=517425 RepID=UPI000EB1A2D0|nr:P-loop NTPase [Salisediminibacterium halotolerans]RLJ73178.1 ATP-binding protein involved in chromosome partitioning [Actinophytocola xinjiangensis]RPE86600.1 ATP-binding protein involved in chromosome partitioning [Salisediminibacterium halotolerans]TWG33975.1 ATP-binding protein involved in chromosome partitioning [Salisediminibacterium halotolerans]GEL06617.1 iron-sulfur cluster carrier protein [Salisediminibacterium halotolerans]